MGINNIYLELGLEGELLETFWEHPDSPLSELWDHHQEEKKNPEFFLLNPSN